MSAAPSAAATTSTARCLAIPAPACSAASRPAWIGNSRRTGCSAPRASIPGSARATSHATFPGGYVYTNDQRGLGSITARIGYTWGPGLLYVKGGYAYSDNSERVTLAGVPTAFLLNGNHSNGWTVGAGVEYMFAPNWSVKGEYMYYDFGSSRFVTPAALAPFGNFHTDDHTLKLGVNYRFNFASPVVARY